MSLRLSPLRSFFALSLVASSSALAGTISLFGPLTTDESTGISSANTYTHAISGGSAASIGGVDFTVLTPAGDPPGITWESTGNKASITLENANIGSWVPAEGGVTGPSLLGLMSSFTYAPQGAEPGSSQTFTLTGLTAGVTYDTRLYVRVWDTTGSGRPIQFTATNGSEVDPFAGPEDRPGDLIGGSHHQVYYVNYNYTAQGDSLVINAAVPADAVANSGSFHMYALTNQVVPEPGSAALVGAVALAAVGRRRGQPVA